MSRDRDEDGRRSGRRLPARLDPRGGGARTATGGTGAAGQHDDGRRSSRAAVVARAVAAVLSVVLLAGSGWGWYLARVADATVTRTDAIPGDGNADAGNAPEAMNLLLVGNDSRADLTPEQLAELDAGVDSGTNTDTMILMHVPADGSSASFVSFPRDSYVQIPGHGMDKLNAAYAYGYAGVDESASEVDRRTGGAQLLVRTISRLTGQRIDHYAEVDLLGFFELTSVVGGVEVNLCSAVDDRAFSGAVFPAGPQTISGVDALRFVRQRHGVRPDGTPALPRGDLDRIVRQQVFIAGVLRKLLSEDVLRNPGKQRELVEAAARSLTVDRDLELLDLARQMQSVTAGDIDFRTVPIVDPDARDGQGRSILRLADEDTLHRFFAGLSADPATAAPEAPSTVAASEVPVAVYNGSRVPGLAAKAASTLEAAGFSVVGTGNADRDDYARTTIRHAPGDEALAATLAAQIPGAVTEVADAADAGTVQLILAADFGGTGPSSGSPASGAPGVPRTAADTSCIN